jgi:hypothetical protein
MIKNELSPFQYLALACADLLAADPHDDDDIDDACSTICDLICTIELTDRRIRLATNAANAIDPTASTHAAHIRDTIRDNTDPSALD